MAKLKPKFKQSFPAAQLDEKLMSLKRLALVQPRDGWIKAIRKRMGMQQNQLAKRMGISAPAVNKMELAEKEERIELATLRKAAEALGCRLFYAFIPNQPIQEVIADHARRLAEQIVAESEKHMLLEAQGTSSKQRAARVEELASQLAEQLDKRIWGIVDAEKDR